MIENVVESLTANLADTWAAIISVFVFVVLPFVTRATRKD